MRREVQGDNRGRFRQSTGHIRLFILERHVERQNERILDALGHVGVTRAVVHDEALDELRVGVGLVLHLHNLNHVQVDRVVLLRCGGRRAVHRRVLVRRCPGSGRRGRRGWLADGQNGVDNVGRELFRELGVQLGGEGGVCDGDEGGAVQRGRLLERLEELRTSV